MTEIVVLPDLAKVPVLLLGTRLTDSVLVDSERLRVLEAAETDWTLNTFPRTIVLSVIKRHKNSILRDPTQTGDVAWGTPTEPLARMGEDATAGPVWRMIRESRDRTHPKNDRISDIAEPANEVSNTPALQYRLNRYCSLDNNDGNNNVRLIV